MDELYFKMYINPPHSNKMKFLLFILFSQIIFIHAQQNHPSQVRPNAAELEVKYYSSEDADSETIGDGCHTASGAVKKVGVECLVLMNRDDTHTSGFDFVSRSAVKMPVESTNGAMTFEIKPTQVGVTYDGCSGSWDGTTGVCTVSTGQAGGTSLKTIGSRVFDITFNRLASEQNEQGELNQLKVRIHAENVPSMSCDGACFGDKFVDGLSDAEANLVLKSGNSIGSAHLYVDSDDSRQQLSIDAGDVLQNGNIAAGANGVMIEFDFHLGFVDDRYDVLDDEGFNLLPDKVHKGSAALSLSMKVVGFDLDSKYIEVGYNRNTVEVTNIEFNKVGTTKSVGGCSHDITDNTVACTHNAVTHHIYEATVKIQIPYPRLKHMKEDYLLNDGNQGCTTATCADGFKIYGPGVKAEADATIFNPTFVDSSWNVYIPRRTITANQGSVITFASTRVNPNYGLVVLPTADTNPADGIPLDHLFSIGDLEGYDELATYDTTYELFDRLHIKQDAGTISEHYVADGGALNGANAQVLCSSGQLTGSTYGNGKAYNLGDTSTSLTLYTNLFKTCRIEVESVGALNQALLTWDNTYSLLGDGSYQYGGDGNRPTNVGSGQKVKLTVDDVNTNLRIGSTPLSLLRKQEVPLGHGVEVNSDQVTFELYGTLNEAFDIYGSDGLLGFNAAAENAACGTVNDLFTCPEYQVIASSGGTLKTLTATNKCNGKLDIQLRERTTKDLLREDATTTPLLRRTYDVRLPCSRVSNAVSDSVNLKFIFDVQYTLKTNSYDITWDKVAGGVAYMGTCAQLTAGSGCEAAPFDDLGSGTGDTDEQNKREGVKPDECSSLALVAENGELKADNINMAIKYTGGTSGLTNDICKEQKFMVHVNAEKTAAVDLTSGVNQNTLSRTADVTEIEYVTCTAGYALQFKIELSEGSGDGLIHNLRIDSYTDGSAGGVSFTHDAPSSATDSDILVTSNCVAIDDCVDDAAFNAIKAAHSFDFIVSGTDNNALPTQSGTRVESSMSINIQYQQCPLAEVDVQENTADGFGELDLDMLLDDYTKCMDGTCSENPCTGCQVASSDATGTIRMDANFDGALLQGYSDAGNGAGVAKTNALFEIKEATYVLKRYERLLDGTKGAQIDINAANPTHEICSHDGNTFSKTDLVLVSAVPAGCTSGVDCTTEAITLVPDATAAFQCNIPFEPFVDASMSDDIYEVEVTVQFKSTARRLRAVHTLGASPAKSGDVGFRIVSSEAQVVDDVVRTKAKESAEGDVAKENETPRDDTLYMVLLIGAILGGVLLLAVLVHCTGLITVPQLAASGSMRSKAKVFEKKKYTNLRY